MNGIGSHQSAKMKNDEWLTPRFILDALGEFDLDPCSPINRPWDPAKKHYNINPNGKNNAEILKNCKIPGKYIQLKKEREL